MPVKNMYSIAIDVDPVNKQQNEQPSKVEANNYDHKDANFEKQEVATS